MPHPSMEHFAQEPLPNLRDPGEPLLDVSAVSKQLGMSGESVRDLARNRKLMGFERNAQAKKGQEQKTHYKFPARAIRLYEAATANFTAADVAVLLLDVAKRLSPRLRLWLRNELSRTLNGSE